MIDLVELRGVERQRLREAEVRGVGNRVQRRPSQCTAAVVSSPVGRLAKPISQASVAEKAFTDGDAKNAKLCVGGSGVGRSSQWLPSQCQTSVPT